MEQQTDYRALYEAANDLLHVERQQVKELNSMLADAQATIAALQADNRTYINERHENMKQIEQLQAMNNRLGVRVETLQSQLTQRTAELEAAQRERDEAAKDRDDWITSWRALQRHNERIEAELERVRGELATYKETKHDAI